jgi:hypothetical protein
LYEYIGGFGTVNPAFLVSVLGIVILAKVGIQARRLHCGNKRESEEGHRLPRYLYEYIRAA